MEDIKLEKKEYTTNFKVEDSGYYNKVEDCIYYNLKNEKFCSMDGTEISITDFIIDSMSPIRIIVGTNGYKGGNYHHGSRTTLSILASGYSTNIPFIDAIVENGDNWGVKIEFGGDSELDTLIIALRLAANELEALKNNQ